MKLLSIGYGQFVNTSSLVAMVDPEAAPIKRLVAQAKEGKMLIDATKGRRTRTVIVHSNGHITLSAIMPDTLAKNLSALE
jgi:hypothetical protein